MEIDKYEAYCGEDIFYDENFRIDIESHIDYIKQKSNIATFEPNIALKYKGDFNGLMDYLKVKKKLHFVGLLINNLTSPGEYNGESQAIYVPPDGIVDIIKDTYTARIELF